MPSAATRTRAPRTPARNSADAAGCRLTAPLVGLGVGDDAAHLGHMGLESAFQRIDGVVHRLHRLGRGHVAVEGDEQPVLGLAGAHVVDVGEQADAVREFFEPGLDLVVDGGREAGPSPVETMLVSLAACSSIDVVEGRIVVTASEYRSQHRNREAARLGCAVPVLDPSGFAAELAQIIGPKPATVEAIKQAATGPLFGRPPSRCAAERSPRLSGFDGNRHR